MRLVSVNRICLFTDIPFTNSSTELVHTLIHVRLRNGYNVRNTRMHAYKMNNKKTRDLRYIHINYFSGICAYWMRYMRSTDTLSTIFLTKCEIIYSVECHNLLALLLQHSRAIIAYSLVSFRSLGSSSSRDLRNHTLPFLRNRLFVKQKYRICFS